LILISIFFFRLGEDFYEQISATSIFDFRFVLRFSQQGLVHRLNVVTSIGIKKYILFYY
jgi:hypothetical protein